MGDRSKDPTLNPQYQSTEGTYGTQTNQTYNKQTCKHKNTANPLVYTNMG